MDEKVAIAKNYLIPQEQKRAGLKEDQVALYEDVIRELIESYCREAGVRNLQMQIEKILRKVLL